MAEQIQKKAPKSHVVKAFNYAFASKMADPNADGTKLDAYIAGDHEPSKQKALQFAESIGFRPVDAGPLAMARVLEGMGLLNILLQIKHHWPWQSGSKLAGPTRDQKEGASTPVSGARASGSDSRVGPSRPFESRRRRLQ